MQDETTAMNIRSRKHGQEGCLDWSGRNAGPGLAGRGADGQVKSHYSY